MIEMNKTAETTRPPSSVRAKCAGRPAASNVLQEKDTQFDLRFQSKTARLPA
jgi:hypothetical protein